MEQYGYNNGYSRGMEDGIEQGREEERKKLISNLRSSGFSDEQIAQLLSITLEEVRK